jgi:hypothetical protein
LGSNGTPANGLWIEESKVHVSPNGSKMIFGYALISSMGAVMSENRYLVRILSYDMSTRQASVIREWKATDVSSMSPEYVEFCVDYLVVNWNSERIYFSEERPSSMSASGFTKLVSCKFDGSALQAVKQFANKTNGMSEIKLDLDFLKIDEANNIIRATLSTDSMGNKDSEEIQSLDLNGNQVVVPINNDDIGGFMSFTAEAFDPFSLTSDGSKILFAQYEGENSAAGEPGKVSLLSLTKEGYDKQAYWSYDGNQSVLGILLREEPTLGLPPCRTRRMERSSWFWRTKARWQALRII